MRHGHSLNYGVSSFLKKVVYIVNLKANSCSVCVCV